MYLISADIRGAGMDKSIIYCFDPTIVVARLREVFKEINVTPQERSRNDLHRLVELEAPESAIEIAAADARRRGPIWTFELSTAASQKIRGRAERYCVTFISDAPIPEDFRIRIIAFLKQLQFSECVEIKSVRLEGNIETPT